VVRCLSPGDGSQDMWDVTLLVPRGGAYFGGGRAVAAGGRLEGAERRDEQRGCASSLAARKGPVELSFGCAALPGAWYSLATLCLLSVWAQDISGGRRCGTWRHLWADAANACPGRGWHGRFGWHSR